MDRREFVKSVSGTALLGATAGCLGGGEGGEATETAGAGGESGGSTQTATDTETATAEEETGTETEEEGTAGQTGDIQGEVNDTPQGLSVTNHELYQQNGEVGLRATVENTGDEPFAYVEAEVTLQDDQGEVLYEFVDETEEDQITQLATGKTWQFDVTFEEAQLSEVRKYVIDLEGDVANEQTSFDDIVGEADQQDPNLEITSHRLTRRESTTYVEGTIRNVGSEAVESAEVSVTLYDDSDQELTDFNDTVEEENDVQQLAPGQVWDFQVQFTDVDMQNVARYVVSVDSDLV
ncbi:FxLYD domain-containing protein [Haloarcula nitratireducens]|uniref:DUF3426 domain-containing protein n=1 Tax=Haloarcula nitratireducens TaxID=2487749 RepID=A0AAW4PAC1_9EURY|nr:FxLYD domain-containing protein [Halomicroarcula nitratireducens]MBX0294854.1 DUF3426 domain-containing protein [Halomicroarcula nitratireducens]